MSEDKFLLHKEFKEALTKEQFILARNAYMHLVKNSKYEIKSTKHILELIQNIKRSPEIIGPYQKMSVFEALNRIGSDLVLLSGAEKLFHSKIQPEKILIKMGNTHGFDFEVFYNGDKVIYSEAFNAAPSFCKHKIRQEIDKLIDKNPNKKATSAIILINEEVMDILEKYINKKEEKSQLIIDKIYCNTNIQNSI